MVFGLKILFSQKMNNSHKGRKISLFLIKFFYLLSQEFDSLEEEENVSCSMLLAKRPCFVEKRGDSFSLLSLSMSWKMTNSPDEHFLLELRQLAWASCIWVGVGIFLKLLWHRWCCTYFVNPSITSSCPTPNLNKLENSCMDVQWIY